MKLIGTQVSQIWGRQVERAKKTRRGRDQQLNMILSKNQSLWILLLEEQSLLLFLLDSIQLEVSLGLPFLHYCRPAKRLKQDGKDVHCINYNCHKKNNKLRYDLNAVDKNNAFLTNVSFLQVFKLCF